MKRENINGVVENYLNRKMKIKPILRKNLSLGNIPHLLSFYSDNNTEIEFDNFTVGQLRGQGEIFEKLLNSQFVRKNPDIFAFFATMYTMYINPKLLKNIYVPFMKRVLDEKLLDSFGEEFKDSIVILFPENKELKEKRIAEITKSIDTKTLISTDEGEEGDTTAPDDE